MSEDTPQLSVPPEAEWGPTFDVGRATDAYIATIPAADRDKLFMPYYSTKRRGSGLGLAIVWRVIAEHGGSIEVADNVPTGTVFTIELPT